jgi:hypothetical protein
MACFVGKVDRYRQSRLDEIGTFVVCMAAPIVTLTSSVNYRVRRLQRCSFFDRQAGRSIDAIAHATRLQTHRQE